MLGIFTDDHALRSIRLHIRKQTTRLFNTKYCGLRMTGATAIPHFTEHSRRSSDVSSVHTIKATPTGSSKGNGTVISRVRTYKGWREADDGSMPTSVSAFSVVSL